MFSAFAAAFRTPDLRRKLFFTLGIIGIFRIGSVIPAPGVSYTAVQTCVDSVQDNSIYGLINLFSGGALLQLSIFALGIMPYITASIIIQLLTVVIPRLESLKKEGQAGQARITQFTRYLTVGLAILQSTTIITLARTPGRLFQGCNEQLLPNQSIQMLLTIVVVMTAGASLIFWLGELITDRGVGNGMSILIFSSIISTFPGQLSSIFTIDGSLKFILVLLVIGVTIPVQYAKRQVGRKSYGGTSTYLPIKVNQAGVIPVIFASSLLYLPSLIVQLTGSQAGWAQWVATYMDPGRSGYLTLNFLLIMFFAYFYVSITFNPEETADNMKQYGGFIPGIRAGKPTAEYLAYVLNRITLPGSLYLATIATLPYLAFAALGVGTRFAFGGTSILIIVGVGLDTVKQIESQLQQRNYEGFLK
jgi:preprotein translocase subunit SecY